MQRYLYRPRLLPILLAGLFFGACGALFVHRARSNDRGLIINHVIELDVTGATIFHWVLAVLSFAFVAAALASLLQRSREPRYLELSGDSVSVPKRWSQGALTIRYDEIREIVWQSISGQHVLELKGASKKVNIAAIMLESKASYDEIGREIEARVEALHAGTDDDGPDEDSAA